MESTATRPCPARLDPVVLNGEFVRLEPLEARHAADLQEAARSDAAIWDHMPSRVNDASDLDRMIASALEMAATGLSLPFAVIAQDSGRAVGSTRYLDYQPAHRGIEIGWTWYSAAHQGTAVNPE